MQNTLNSWFRGLGELGVWFLYRSLEVSVDVSVTANAQSVRAVESYHLVADYTRRRNEHLVDITNLLTDHFSEQILKAIQVYTYFSFLLEYIRQVKKYPLRSYCLSWNLWWQEGNIRFSIIHRRIMQHGFKKANGTFGQNKCLLFS